MSPARRFCPVPPAKLKYCYFWLTLAMEVPSLKSRCGASFPAPVKKVVVSGANAPLLPPGGLGASSLDVSISDGRHSPATAERQVKMVLKLPLVSILKLHWGI